MINSIYKVANNFKDKVSNVLEYQKVLKECTSNENWNISNTQLQVLADHSYNWNDYTVIMKHLWTKLNSKPKEWRRIFKALHAIEYLIKNGAPRVVQDIKDDLFKIRALQDFNYNDNGTERGQGVRDRSKAICELMSDPQKLQEEREFARKTRDKFMGISSSGPQSNGMTGNPSQAAAPASGKYGGFGSEDIDKFGYKPGFFNAPYDPFSGGHSVPTGPEETKKNKVENVEQEKKKKHHHKKNKDSDSEDSDKSSDSSSDSDSDSDESDEDDKKKKKKSSSKKQKSKGLGQVPKATRQIEESQQSSKTITQQQQQPQPSLLDLLETPPTQSSNTPSNQTEFFFMSQPTTNTQPTTQQTKPTDLFSQLNLNQQQPISQSNLTQQFNQLNFGQSSFNNNTNNGFSFMNTASQQQQPLNMMGNQQQTSTQQNNNIFANLSLNNSKPNTQQELFNFGSAPAQSQQQQQQYNGPTQPSIQQNSQQNQKDKWQPKSNDVWSEGQGLFDLNNLSKGNVIETSHSNVEKGNDLLHVKEQDHQTWHMSPNQLNLQGSQGMGNVSAFANNQTNAKFIPNINMNALFQPQQQQQYPQNPLMNMGYQGQQQQPIINPMMQQQFPPQFYGQQQQQRPLNPMMQPNMMPQQQPLFMNQPQMQQMQFGNPSPSQNSSGFNFMSR